MDLVAGRPPVADRSVDVVSPEEAFYPRIPPLNIRQMPNCSRTARTIPLIRLRKPESVV